MPERPTESECRALVERVEASSAFKTSPRLRGLLEYLCRHAMEFPNEALSEHDLGVAVFGRSPGYDSTQDTIVRVQASQLRKRLQQYFLSEGVAEAFVIEIPKGSYLPVFTPRTQVHHAVAPLLEVVPAPFWWKAATFTLAGLLCASVVLCGWLWQRHTNAGGVDAVEGPTPYRDHLWSQLFRNGRQTYVVTSDANTGFLTSLLDRPVTAEEYGHASFPRLQLDSWIADSQVRQVMARFMAGFNTTTQDAMIASQIFRTAGRYACPFHIVHARIFRPLPESVDNQVFLGNRKSNPWVELYEDKTNFAYAWDPVRKTGLLLNRAPRAGEKQEYPVDGGRAYGTVSYVSRRGGGSTVILGGNDMGGVELGGRMLCDEAAVKQLHSILKIGATGPIPHFELLLSARRALNASFDSEVIAWRVYPR